MLAGDGVSVEHRLSAVARDVSLADRVVDEWVLRFVYWNKVTCVERV
jgi:hypothetical protein